MFTHTLKKRENDRKKRIKKNIQIPCVYLKYFWVIVSWTSVLDLFLSFLALLLMWIFFLRELRNLCSSILIHLLYSFGIFVIAMLIFCVQAVFFFSQTIRTWTLVVICIHIKFYGTNNETGMKIFNYYVRVCFEMTWHGDIVFTPLQSFP